MPCDSSYMNPTDIEKNRKQVATLILFVNKKLKKKTSDRIVRASKHCYGEGVDLDKDTAKLCEKIREMTDQELDFIVYNGRDKTSRQLADWWETHKAADEKRRAKEKKKAEQILKELARRSRAGAWLLAPCYAVEVKRKQKKV